MVKNLPVNTGDIRDKGSIPRLGRSPGGGNGNPLQYSCLENLMDREDWQAVVHRVTKSQIQLKWLSTPCTQSIRLNMSWVYVINYLIHFFMSFILCSVRVDTWWILVEFIRFSSFHLFLAPIHPYLTTTTSLKIKAPRFNLTSIFKHCLEWIMESIETRLRSGRFLKMEGIFRLVWLWMEPCIRASVPPG